jgi:hypothetical protein
MEFPTPDMFDLRVPSDFAEGLFSLSKLSEARNTAAFAARFFTQMRALQSGVAKDSVKECKFRPSADVAAVHVVEK